MAMVGDHNSVSAAPTSSAGGWYETCAATWGAFCTSCLRKLGGLLRQNPTGALEFFRHRRSHAKVNAWTPYYSSLSDLSIRYFRTITYTSMHACARALHDAVTASTPAASSLLQLVWVQKLGWGRRFLCRYCCSQNIVMVGRTSTVR